MALAALIVALVALFAWAGAEAVKRPRLEIRPAEWARSGDPWVFAVVRVRNRPLTRALRWFLVRQSAEGCEALIEFRRANEIVLAIPEVVGRWSGRPQPIKPAVVRGKLVGIYDSDDPRLCPD